MIDCKLLGVVVGLTLASGVVDLASAAEGERRGPPPEAIAACEDREEGSACAVEFRGRTMNGKCVAGPQDDDPLVCMPGGGGPPAPPPAAFEACEGAAENDPCSVDIHEHTVTGVCREARGDAEGLVCVPDRPPER